MVRPIHVSCSLLLFRLHLILQHLQPSICPYPPVCPIDGKQHGCLLRIHRGEKMGYYRYPQQPNSCPAMHTSSPFNPLGTKKAIKSNIYSQRHTTFPPLVHSPQQEKQYGRAACLKLQPWRDPQKRGRKEKKKRLTFCFFSFLLDIVS